MRFSEYLKEEKFVVTTDVISPKGTDIEQRLASLQKVKGLVHGINCTDMPGASLRLGSLAMSVKVKELGFEPILQLTCRDRNRLSLQAELLSASLLGVHNILALGGDDLERTDHPGTKEVFDLDSPGLVNAANRLRKGFDLAGNPLNGSPKLCVGAALDPSKENWEEEVEKAWKKAEAGADFFQTQPIFDMDSYAKFLDRLGKINLPILGGVFLLTSAKMAHFFNSNVPGVIVPDKVIKQLEVADPVKASMEMTTRLIKEMREICSGVHIMMVTDWHHHIPEILNGAGVTSKKLNEGVA
jgi:methylenetetrahydrofolate reductase (NADPH)